MMPAATVAYERLRPQLDTGDVVLFAGRGPFAAAIRYATSSQWSHVGMVVRDRHHGVLLWESTTLRGVQDVEAGRVRKGVQLVSLSQRIATYPGEVAIRILECRRTEDMLRALGDLREELRGRPYERSPLDLAASALDGTAQRPEDLSSLFCSELVAEAYQRMGLVDDERPSSEYVPADFAWGGKLALIPPARFAREEWVQAVA